MIVRIFILSLISCSLWAAPNLQTQIEAEPLRKNPTGSDQVLPNTEMQLHATIRNEGDTANKPGEIWLRFAFPKPLDKQPRSVLFETEKISLPEIAPGEQIEITFSKTHRWPALYDFIKQDWGMRQYEAIIKVDQKEYLSGLMMITFTANYYPGFTKALSTSIPDQDRE